jgi:hypothetical protein
MKTLKIIAFYSYNIPFRYFVLYHEYIQYWWKNYKYSKREIKGFFYLKKNNFPTTFVMSNMKDFDLRSLR